MIQQLIIIMFPRKGDCRLLMPITTIYLMTKKGRGSSYCCLEERILVSAIASHVHFMDDEWQDVLEEYNML
eukprot:7404294-Ditylum_brightwellii.AAC.1